jgi:hypothetical protein
MESSLAPLTDQNAGSAPDLVTNPVPANGRRRSTARLPISTPIVIKGTDAAGRSFIEHSRTLLINKAGLKTVSKQALSPGIRIQIAVPSRQRVSWATIAWLGEKKTDGQEVGIALEQTDDFWGLEFPPATSMPGDHQPEQGPDFPARNGSWNGRSGSSDKLSGALRELAQSAIEEALEEALKAFRARADEMQSKEATQFAAQLQGRVEQALSAAGERLETQVAELLSRWQRDWERNLELLDDAASEQMRSRRAEQEQLLVASAEKISRDLGERLSAASRLLTGSRDLPA